MTGDTMGKYQITNTISGVELGVYEGATEAEALDAMARDAGYSDYAECCEVAPARQGEIAVQPAQVDDDQQIERAHIVGRYAFLDDTEAGKAARAEFCAAIGGGRSHSEAEIIAANVLQRAGYNVNAGGGVTIHHGRQVYTWRTDAASGRVRGNSADDALAQLVRDGEWAGIDSAREAAEIADGAFLFIRDADGLDVCKRGIVP